MYIAARFNEAAANGRGNLENAGVTAGGAACFNEAAANGRGNALAVADRALDRAASMRPRRMAAEILARRPQGRGEHPLQ